MRDFVIENGVLTKYTGCGWGPGGEFIFPAGITEIGSGAFRECISLTSVTIPVGVTEINKEVFEGCCPALIAPHIPIYNIAKEDKPEACAGFAKAYLDGREIDEETKVSYLKYIKGQKKRLYPLAVRHETLLQLMFAEKMIPRKDVELLLEECEKQKNTAAKAAVLEYAHQLDTADFGRNYKL